MENPLLEAPVPGQVPRWQLSAPESYVLLHGPHASGAEAFKKGLLELAARGMLKLERRTRNRFLWFTATHSILLPGPKMAAIHAAPAPLRAIHSLYLSTRCFDPPGVRVKDLPGGSGRWIIKSFASHVVMPTLVERGLYRFVDGYQFGIVPMKSFTETPRGLAARAELEALMQTAERDFTTSVTRDPAQALALLGSLGAAILLMQPLLPELQRLSQLVHKGIGDLSPVAFSLSGLDLDSLDFDPDGLHGLDSSSFDGFDGDGGGGGDGGGWGDGGGGD